MLPSSQPAKIVSSDNSMQEMIEVSTSMASREFFPSFSDDQIRMKGSEQDKTIQLSGSSFINVIGSSNPSSVLRMEPFCQSHNMMVLSNEVETRFPDSIS